MSDAGITNVLPWSVEYNQEELLAQSQWHATEGYQHSNVDEQIQCEMEAMVYTSQVKLGNVMVDAVVSEETGWFEPLTIYEQRRQRTDIHLVPSPLCFDIKDKVIATAELFSAEAYPYAHPTLRLDNEKPVVATCLTRSCVLTT